MAEDISEHSREAARDLITDEHERVGSRFTHQVSLTTLILAMLIAVASLLSGISANEVLLKRTHEILELSQAESDKVLVEVMKTRLDILDALPSGTGQSDTSVARQLKDNLRNEIQNLSIRSQEEERDALRQAYTHEVLAVSVTILSIAITFGGIALIARRRQFWYFSLGFSAIGFLIFVYGLIKYFG